MFPTQFTGVSFTWERKKLGIYVPITMGQSPNSKNYTNNPRDNILVQGNADLYNNRVLKRTFTTEVTKIADRNDILISVRAPVGDIARNQYESIVIGRGIAAIKGNNFLYYQLEKMNNSGFWKKYIAGSTFESITGKDLKSSDIYISNHKEEKSIGDIFQTLTKTIQLHERKIIQLKQIQKCIQQIITTSSGKNWEFIKLKNILKERKLLSTKSKNYPLVSFTVNDGVTPKTKRYEREQLVRGNVDNKKYKVTKLNDIVYNPANLKFGAIGRNKFGNAVFSPIYITFEAHDIDIIFLEMLLTDPNFIKKSLKYQQGTVYERQSVSPKDLLNMKIIYPPYDLQLKFGHLFGSIQKKIDLEQRKLDQLIKFKNFLLQNMFI